MNLSSKTEQPEQMEIATYSKIFCDKTQKPSALPVSIY